MSYQTSDIVTKVQQRVRDTNFSSTQIVDYLNDTQNDIFNEYRLPFMEATQTYTLSVGTSDITNGANLPTNFAQHFDLTNTFATYEKLIPYKDIREIDYLYPDPDDTTQHATGTPVYWYYYAQTARVYPAPDKAYTLLLRYYKKPTLLVNDADVPSVPSQFQELLVMGAAYRVLQTKDNYDQAAILQNKFDELLDKLVVQASQKQIGHQVQMRINKYQVSKRSF